MTRLLLLLTLCLAQDGDPQSPRRSDDADMPPERRAAREALRNVPRERLNRMFESEQAIMESLRRAGPWEEQYGMMMDALGNVFERNQWDSESDQFALDLVAHVEAIEPWKGRERLEAVSDLLRERYNLDEDQLGTLRGIFVRNMIEMFAAHGDRIMEYSTEMLGTRADRAAITPEQVQRWAELGQPVVKDMRERMDHMIEAFSAELRPEQREVLDRDAKAAFRRVDTVAKQAEGWARGEWKPDDWGMAEDPIQLEGEREGRFGGRREDGPAAAGGDLEADENARAAREAAGGNGSGGADGTRRAGARETERRNGTRDDGARRDSSGKRADRELPEHPDEMESGNSREPRRPEGDSRRGESDARGAGGEREPLRHEGEAHGDPTADARSGGKGDSRSTSKDQTPDDEWARYVKSFIAKYSLDAGQQSRAWVIYRDLKQRGDRARTRIDTVVKPLETQLAAAKDSAAREKLNAQIKTAKKPLDDAFNDLKRRLEGLPTRAQRAAAEGASGGKSRKAATPATGARSSQPASESASASRPSPKTP